MSEADKLLNPGEGGELMAQAAEKDTQASTGGSRAGGCLSLVVMGIGAIFGGAVVLWGVLAIFGSEEEEATNATANDGNVPAANLQTGILLGRWQFEIGSIVGSESLVHREGVMYTDSRYEGGDKVFPDVVVERPSGLPDVRKFDPNPDARHGEYFTISASGVMKWFAWEGREVYSAEVEQLHPDAMSIGFNPVPRTCTPTELSTLALETVKLYEELHSFKDANAFATFGFSQNGPYYAWLEAVQHAADNEGGMEVLTQLGFPPAELINLGLSHMRLATSEGRNMPANESDRRFVHDSERKVQAGIALAECRGQ